MRTFEEHVLQLQSPPPARLTVLFWACCFAAIAGCTLPGPVAFRHDPAALRARNEGGALVNFRVAIAPIQVADTLASALSSSPLDSDSASLVITQSLDLSAYKFEMPPETRALQEDLRDLLEWSGFFEDVYQLKGVEKHTDLCELAEMNSARLLLELYLKHNSVRYVGESGFIYWLNVLNWWAFSPPFTWWVPDEIFEVSIQVDVRLRDVRTQKTIYQHSFTASYEDELNEFMHGFQIVSWAHTPANFGPENWKLVHDQLYPHALQRLKVDVLRHMSETIPVAFDDNSLATMTRGTDGAARTLGIVVGSPGPGADSLANSVRDAEAVERLLMTLGAKPNEIRLLTGREANREGIFAAIEEIRRKERLRIETDRVVFYFSGFGLHDDRGCVLVTSDSCGQEDRPPGVSLTELADAMQYVRPKRVLFLLDTSFAGEGGRTLNAGTPLDPTTFLDELSRPELGWCTIAAAGAGESAGEPTDLRHGLFTHVLLQLPVGAFTAKKIHEYVKERVGYLYQFHTGSPQTPQLVGDFWFPVVPSDD